MGGSLHEQRHLSRSGSWSPYFTPLSCPQQMSLCHGYLVSSTLTLTAGFSSQQAWDSGLAEVGWVEQGVRGIFLCSCAPALGRVPLWTESGLDTERIQNYLWNRIYMPGTFLGTGQSVSAFMVLTSGRERHEWNHISKCVIATTTIKFMQERNTELWVAFQGVRLRLGGLIRHPWMGLPISGDSFGKAQVARWEVEVVMMAPHMWRFWAGGSLVSSGCPQNPEKASVAGAQEAKSRQAEEVTLEMSVFAPRALGLRGSEAGRVTIMSAFVKDHRVHSVE